MAAVFVWAHGGLGTIHTYADPPGIAGAVSIAHCHAQRPSMALHWWGCGRGGGVVCTRWCRAAAAAAAVAVRHQQCAVRRRSGGAVLGRHLQGRVPACSSPPIPPHPVPCDMDDLPYYDPDLPESDRTGDERWLPVLALYPRTVSRPTLWANLPNSPLPSPVYSSPTCRTRSCSLLHAAHSNLP